MPGRARRALFAHAPARSARWSRRRVARRRSRTEAGSPARRAWRPPSPARCRKSISASTTIGCTMASSSLSAGLRARQSLAEQLAIDLAAARRAGKRRLDRRNRVAFIEAMHAGIGVEHGHPGPREMLGRRRFAHADAAGEADDQHHEAPSEAATWALQRRRHLRAARRTSARSPEPPDAAACRAHRPCGCPWRAPPPAAASRAGYRRCRRPPRPSAARRDRYRAAPCRSCRGWWR